MKVIRKHRRLCQPSLWLALAAMVTGGASLRADAEAVTTRAATKTTAASPAATGASVSVAAATPREASPQPSHLTPAAISALNSRLRDPFRAPEEPKPGLVDHGPVKPRPPGIGGLLVDQVRLQGIVREEVTHHMVAMVASRSNLSYFLREGDRLYDGQVIRITSDGLYIRRTEPASRAGAREIALRLGPDSGGQE